jgi:hypothetical protein
MSITVASSSVLLRSWMPESDSERVRSPSYENSTLFKRWRSDRFCGLEGSRAINLGLVCPCPAHISGIPNRRESCVSVDGCHIRKHHISIHSGFTNKSRDVGMISIPHAVPSGVQAAPPTSTMSSVQFRTSRQPNAGFHERCSHASATKPQKMARNDVVHTS